ncbi:hypothetical protein BDV30DRAFT_50599 [Aspergillus minisclerotigenes]|uniref:Uncharacterized protein n=1 Tax=Aspergillus minisclerotigenes TaxID=656917 RepID=A0A5N6IMK4_9EURO|nr:hypothetical protein BDV30DRAFT_50599 [Aspergillus minisclerotigenes]
MKWISHCISSIAHPQLPPTRILCSLSTRSASTSSHTTPSPSLVFLFFLDNSLGYISLGDYFPGICSASLYYVFI